jgi:hypothetical protein
VRSPSCRTGKQSGYVLVLSVILLGLFLSLAAAAIDMGNLYVWQLRLDKAVRAGALAGLGYRSMNGWQTIYGGEPDYSSTPRTATNSQNIATLLNVADTAVKDNFKMSFPSSLTNWSAVTNTVETNLKPCNSGSCRAEQLSTVAPAAYDPKADTIELTYQYEVPTFFAGRLRGTFGSFPMCNSSQGTGCVITSKQSAQLDYANILMLLDVSGSMNTVVPGETNRYIDKLITSAQQFSKLFNPFRDRISVIPFNLGAQVAFSFASQQSSTTPGTYSFGATQNLWTNFKSTIASLTPQSNTNPCDALIYAMSELNTFASLRSVQPSEMKPFVVFFSDGAPNAFRGSFSNTITTSLSANGVQSNTNNWYHYALEWVVNSSTRYQGPSPLIHAQTSLFNLVPTATTTYTTPQSFTNGNTFCGDIWSDRDPRSSAYFERALNGNLLAGGRRPGCLTDLDFSIPNSASTAVISLPPTAAGETSFTAGNTQIFQELPYYCAIEAADQIRTTFGGTVFAVGLGPTSRTPQCNDPLQDPTDHFTRKDNFLSRLAFDPFTVDSAGSWKPAFQFSPRRQATLTNCGSTKGSTLGYNLLINGTNTPRTPIQLSGTEGQYYPTSEPDDLPFLFAQVAKQILLRLNS